MIFDYRDQSFIRQALELVLQFPLIKSKFKRLFRIGEIKIELVEARFMILYELGNCQSNFSRILEIYNVKIFENVNE